MFTPSTLPDVATHHVADIPKPLQWVGMEDIAIPLLVPVQDIENKKESVHQQVRAKTSLYVSLDRHDAKGIHMSRLHLALNQKLAGQRLNYERIASLVQEMEVSQEGISECARLVLEFDLVLVKPALLSGESAYQSYTVSIDAQRVDGELNVDLELTIPYSSTCPCSASLSRQLYAEAINNRFMSTSIDKEELVNWVISEAGSVATPHSQRSYAYLKLSLVQSQWPDIAALIFQFESIIGTPVQTAVKRQDEQAFARLNAENLMFCEDAARRLKDGLEKMSFVTDYWFKVEHQESLHAHNAVAIDQKFPTNS
ncbi:MAG: GTP cyclohydrolase I [Oleiphilaceae bacterium]|jgi:GTP cyclohydrolase I